MDEPGKSNHDRILKLAYLIICHTDPEHIIRLAKKLTKDAPWCNVFIHIDRKSNINERIEAAFYSSKSIHVIKQNVDVWWGGASAIDATNLLLRTAYETDRHDRFILLQGADYPLASNASIYEFFQTNTCEFIRACNATIGEDKYIYGKSKYKMYFDRPNTLKRLANRTTRLLDLQLRNGYVECKGQLWDIYWGCAQFALSRLAVEYVLRFQNDSKLRKQFDSIFPADEVYFQTIIFNSDFAKKTIRNGPEPVFRRLADSRYLHYFEYPREVRVFTNADYSYLQTRKELFIRKVNTSASASLLDLIDSSHMCG